MLTQTLQKLEKEFMASEKKLVNWLLKLKMLMLSPLSLLIIANIINLNVKETIQATPLSNNSTVARKIDEMI